MSYLNDPRVFFAAERTLLAWLRTGMAVMGVGFLVARFGLFLRMLHPEAAYDVTHLTSAVIGVGFVMLGAASMGIAGWQHLRFCRTIGPAERPGNYWLGMGLWYAFLMAALGVMLAAYLLYRVGTEAASTIQ